MPNSKIIIIILYINSDDLVVFNHFIFPFYTTRANYNKR